MPERIQVAANLGGPVKRVTFMGREHVSVPAVLVRSKVLHNNLGRTFLPPDAITPEWVEVANGRPAVADHPRTTANNPDVLNQLGVGVLFNARAENGALKADVFLDPARAGDVPDLTAILAKLEAGEKVEVSTGFPVSIDETPGALNGEDYDMVIRPLGFDHLAVFAKATGACSVTDGCGLAQNHDGACEESENEEKPVDKKSWLDGVMAKLKDVLASEVPGEALDNEESESADADGNSPEGGDTMNREQMIAQLAEAGRDKDALAKLSDCDLKALMGVEAQNTELPPERPDDSEAMRLAHQYRRENEELKARYEPARQGLEKERAEMLDDLIYNAEKLPYTVAEIKAMDIVQMRKVHKLACPQRADFSGRGAPVANVGAFDWVEPIGAARSGKELQ